MRQGEKAKSLFGCRAFAFSSSSPPEHIVSHRHSHSFILAAVAGCILGEYYLLTAAAGNSNWFSISQSCIEIDWINSLHISSLASWKTLTFRKSCPYQMYTFLFCPTTKRMDFHFGDRFCLLKNIYCLIPVYQASGATKVRHLLWCIIYCVQLLVRLILKD